MPPALEAVILRCLEKQPAQRYPNVGELATALLPFAPARAKASVERISGIVEASGQPSAPALPSPPQRDESTGPGTLPAVGRTTPGRAPGKAWVIGAGFFAGIVVAGGGLRAAAARGACARGGGGGFRAGDRRRGHGVGVGDAPRRARTRARVGIGSSLAFGGPHAARPRFGAEGGGAPDGQAARGELRSPDVHGQQRSRHLKPGCQ